MTGMRRTVPLLDGIAESRSEVRHSKPRAEYGEDTAIPFMNVWAVLLIELYQRKTANRPHVCNFCPSCSEYSRIAFMRYRFLPAFFMTLERLQECSDFFTEWPKQNKPRGKEMSDLKLMACPYCGSPLTPRENDGWYCDGCGRTSVFDREKKITNNIYIQ